MPSRPPTHRPRSPVRTYQRGTAHERGYTSDWQKASRAFLQSHPLCYYCELLGRVVPSEHTDHYNPCPPNTPEFMDETNWRPACSCHNSGKRDTPGDEYVAKLLRDAHG